METNGIIWEMGAEWYGDTDGAFFKFDDISVRRKIKSSFYPLSIYKNHNIKIPELVTNEKRILSVDVALLASKKHNNDAACLIINSAIPTESNEYLSNIVYIETHEGLTTDELGIRREELGMVGSGPSLIPNPSFLIIGGFYNEKF